MDQFHKNNCKTNFGLVLFKCWVGGWVGGCYSHFNDCLQQPKISRRKYLHFFCFDFIFALKYKNLKDKYARTCFMDSNGDEFVLCKKTKSNSFNGNIRKKEKERKKKKTILSGQAGALMISASFGCAAVHSCQCLLHKKPHAFYVKY